MKITPLDIQQQRFRTVFRGLDKGEVDAFLNLVASEVEALNRRVHEIEEENRRQRNLLDEYRDREQTLKETMITAQKITEDIKASAHKEADIILANAEIAAERVVAAAQARLTALLEDINELKRQRTVFLERLRGVLATHRKLLEMELAEPEGKGAIEDNLSVLRRPERVVPSVDDIAEVELDRTARTS
ncbi:MAG: DivIVA domain-containing protein [Deltaproteobacteria bacterium]|nr:DivIVA domain-containing protein [Deltaproteobacteria bacterium]